MLQLRWRRTKFRLVSRSVTSSTNSAMSGLTASTLPVVCGVRAVTCTRNAQKRAMQHQYQHAATASWWKERNLIPPSIEAAATPGKRCERESRRVPKTTTRRASLPATPPQDYPSRRRYAATQQQQQQPHPPPGAQACPATVGEMSAPHP
jgi:hypothetical protein